MIVEYVGIQGAKEYFNAHLPRKRKLYLRIKEFRRSRKVAIRITPEETGYKGIENLKAAVKRIIKDGKFQCNFFIHVVGDNLYLIKEDIVEQDEEG